MTFFGGSNPVQQGNPNYVSSIEGQTGDVDIDPLVQAVLDAQTALGAFADPVQALIDQSILVAVSSLQAQILASAPSLDTIPGTLPAAKIGPVVDAGVTYTQESFNTFISQKAGAGGTPSPTAPVKNAAPTLAFTGGTGDVGENATYTQGTYTGGTVTSRDVNVIVNGVIVSTVTGIANGASIPIPTSAGLGARQFGIIELANWSGGSAVSNPSAIATINAPGVPVNSVAPTITPTSATELNTLTINNGTYTVNGSTVANSTLTFAYRWAMDLTLTGSLVAATSATLTAVWAGTTGTYTVRFSDGSSKSTTLTNNSAGPFTWTGAVTASTAIKVDLSTLQALALNANNYHVMRGYETATGSGGAGTETQCSNTVTPTASSGTVAPGHRYLTSIPAAQWTRYQTNRTAFTVSPGMTSKNAETLVSGIPTSGGVTIGPGANVQNALNTNSIVFLTAGTYSFTTYLTIPASTKLIGVAGSTITLDFSGSGGVGYGLRMDEASHCINVNVYRPPALGIWFNGNNTFCYKVSVQSCGLLTTIASRYGIGFQGAGTHSNVWVSCEALNGQDTVASGGEADGFRLGTAGGGNHTLVDCHGFQNTDDNFDCWDAIYSNFMHDCSGYQAGKNSEASLQGDGNGFKLGRGAVVHYCAGCITNDNLTYGFNRNANSSVPILVSPSSSGDDSGPYAGGASLYTIS